MNERFEALYDQAFTLGTSGYSNGELDVEKFAELIVRECANIAFDKYAATNGAESGESAILKHFGVE